MAHPSVKGQNTVKCSIFSQVNDFGYKTRKDFNEVRQVYLAPTLMLGPAASLGASPSVSVQGTCPCAYCSALLRTSFPVVNPLS